MATAVAILDTLEPLVDANLLASVKSDFMMAQNLQVVDERSFCQMGDLYAKSKNLEKTIEFARKRANEPDQQRINARNDHAKGFLGYLKQIQALAKQKSAEYQTAALKASEEVLKAGADLLGLEDVPEAPHQAFKTDRAMLVTRTVRKFRIVDEKVLDRQYLKPNEEAIEVAVKMGVAQIAGVEIYEEKETQLRTR